MKSYDIVVIGGGPAGLAAAAAAKKSGIDSILILEMCIRDSLFAVHVVERAGHVVFSIDTVHVV